MQAHLPKGTSLAAMLMELLSLSRESIYRRLRGEILFTVDELIKISQELGFSLDNLAAESKGTDKTKWAVTNVDTLFSASTYLEQYLKRMQYLLQTFGNMIKYPHAKERIATNLLPYSFTLLYEKLTLFRHYNWMYLSQGVKPDFYLSDLVLPKEIKRFEKKVIEHIQNIPEVLYILDRNIFYTMVQDINYFFRRGLISEDELLQLKEELLDLLNTMEKITYTGNLSNKKTKIDIYISDKTLDSTYVHLEYDSTEYSFLWLYFIDYMIFQNPKICQKQKNWIELLKRYSTHITQTGEIQRFEFFKEQRELIETKLSLQKVSYQPLSNNS